MSNFGRHPRPTSPPRRGPGPEAEAVMANSAPVDLVLNVYEDNPSTEGRLCQDLVLSSIYGGLVGTTRVCGLRVGGAEFSYFDNGAVRLTPRRMPLFELVREISLGQVLVNDEYVFDILSHLENEFPAQKFDWSLRNSMHFTGQMAHMLLQKRAPPWLVQMADLGKIQLLPKRAPKQKAEIMCPPQLLSACGTCPCGPDQDDSGPVPYDMVHQEVLSKLKLAEEERPSVRWSSLERHLSGVPEQQDEYDDDDLPQLLNHQTAAARHISNLKFPNISPPTKKLDSSKKGSTAARRGRPASGTAAGPVVKPSPLVAYLHRSFAEKNDAKHRSPYDARRYDNTQHDVI